MTAAERRQARGGPAGEDDGPERTGPADASLRPAAGRRVFLPGGPSPGAEDATPEVPNGSGPPAPDRLARATRRRIAPPVFGGAGADGGRGTRWTYGLERGGGPGTVPCGPAGEGAGPGNPAQHRRWTGAVGGTERRVGGGGAATAPAQAVDVARRPL
jgi:hypothetical protein